LGRRRRATLASTAPLSDDGVVIAAGARRMRQLCLAAILWAASALALAQQSPLDPPPRVPPPPPSPITDHFSISGSLLIATASTKGHVDDPNSPIPGTPISFEQDLGLTPDVHQGRVEFIFRLRERSRLRVDMWELNRSAAATPSSTIVFGDITLLPTDVVNTTFNWRQIDMTYTYSVLRGRRYELGLGVGAHAIQGEADARVWARALHESFTGAGPFATVALDGTWLINDRYSINARAQYLSLNFNSNSGSLGDYHADVQYRWRPNLAFGLGYESTHAHVEVRNSNPNGEMTFDVHGGELFVRASF
jgi:hypothetical protein